MFRQKEKNHEMWKITERMLPSFNRIWANMRYKQRAVSPEKYQLNDFLIRFRNAYY